MSVYMYVNMYVCKTESILTSYKKLKKTATNKQNYNHEKKACARPA